MYNGQKIDYIIALVIAAIIAMIFFSGTPGRSSSDKNGVDQRNHKRDRIECESKGGFLGQGGWTQDSGYSICHDVDSLIVLNGPREEH